MRKVLLSGVMAVALFSLAGCEASPKPFACTPVGYLNTALIELAAPAVGLQLQLCGGEGCVPGPVETPVELASTETPLATGVFQMDGDSVKGWTATLLDAPTLMGFRIIQADGTMKAEGQVEVAWTRVSGSERCGGNQEAEIVIAT